MTRIQLTGKELNKSCIPRLRHCAEKKKERGTSRVKGNCVNKITQSEDSSVSKGEGGGC